MAKKNRRAHGEGGITHRQDGRYMVTVECEPIGGKRRRKYAYACTQQEAVMKLRQLQSALDAGLPVMDDRRDLGEWLETWLTQVKTRVRPSTYSSYRGVVERHLLPKLGHVKLSKLAPAHVQELLTSKSADGLSDRTVELIWQILRRALNEAVRLEILRRNVTDKVRPPKVRYREVTPLTVDEVCRVLEATTDHALEAAVVLSLATGMRRGEVLGLRWGDIDVNAQVPTLRVSASMQRVGGALTLVDPKTDKSRRTIALPRVALDALRRRRVAQAEAKLRCGEGWTESDLVFTTSIGTPVDPRNFLRQWHKLLAQAQVPRRPLHHARHTAGSLMLSEGVPLKVVSETLGHSSIQVTADRYGHLMPHDREKAAAAVDRALTA